MPPYHWSRWWPVLQLLPVDLSIPMHSFADSGAELNWKSRHMALSRLSVRSTCSIWPQRGREKDIRFVYRYHIPQCDHPLSKVPKMQRKLRVVAVTYFDSSCRIPFQGCPGVNSPLQADHRSARPVLPPTSYSRQEERGSSPRFPTRHPKQTG